MQNAGRFSILYTIRYDTHMQHPPYVVLQKQRGETPLHTLTRWQKAHPQYAHLPATYAGRLDPMAEGSLLILLGDTCKHQEQYHQLDKTYEVAVLLDIATDTGDVLGLPTYAATETAPSPEDVTTALRTHTGSHLVPYPAFSSKPVAGTPLFQHALQGTLDTITIPTHEEHIYAIRLHATEQMSRAELAAYIDDALTTVPRALTDSKRLGADFRQDAIRAAWTPLIASLPERDFTLLRIQVTCASGTYMRTLAERIGASLGTRACALSIRRTRIGVYQKILGIGWWRKVFV